MPVVPNFNYSPSRDNLEFPLFKFLRSEHADRMMNEGEVFLPNLKLFTQQLYGNSIDDAMEGRHKIISEYSSFEGYTSEIEGLAMLTLGSKRLLIKDCVFEAEYTNADALIYCVSSHIFSDSLNFAIDTKKDSCIMITDGNRFFNSIASKLSDIKTHFYGSCLYVKEDDGSIREKNPRKDSLTNSILHNRKLEYLLKPKKYIEQREVRGVFLSDTTNEEKVIQPQTVRIPECRDLFIRIVFKNTNPEVLTGVKSGNITMSQKRKDGLISHVTFPSSFGAFSPVLINAEEKMIGFYNDAHSSLRNGTITGELPLYISRTVGSILGNVPLSGLDYIELSTEDT